MSVTVDVCEIGLVNDGTLRICCSAHQTVLCAHHYARTHFVETSAWWHDEAACDYGLLPPDTGSVPFSSLGNA